MQECVPCALECFDHLRSLMKCDFVHDHNATLREFRDEVLDDPCIKDLGIGGG